MSSRKEESLWSAVVVMDLLGLLNFPWNLVRRLGLAVPCLSPVLIMLAMVLKEFMVLRGDCALDWGLDWDGVMKGVPTLRELEGELVLECSLLGVCWREECSLREVDWRFCKTEGLNVLSGHWRLWVLSASS